MWIKKQYNFSKNRLFSSSLWFFVQWSIIIIQKDTAWLLHFLLFLHFPSNFHFKFKVKGLIWNFKVAPRIEKTEVFRKGWKFANRAYFASCIMRKHYFLLWTKETAFSPYFYNGILFYSAKLFDCVVNFKFYVNIFIFLNINT